jgi:hypothetical protein
MAQPPSVLPSSQSAFSGIDAAVAAIIENSTSSSSDIIGTAVTLSTVTMDRIESMMQKLRTRGKKLPKSKLPLTVDRPYARAVSPPPKTAISPVHGTAREISPEPRTAFSASPPSSSSRFRSTIPKVNLPSVKTSKEVTPRQSEVYQRLVPAPADPSIRTGRGVSPTPKSSGYPTALEPGTPPNPASRRQSISNVHLPSTRTGREITPRNSNADYKTAPRSDPVRTGRGVSPTPKSSGYRTGVEAATPPRPASQRQSISNVNIPSTRTGRGVTPRNSNADLAPQRSNASTRTGRGVSPAPRSSGYPTALEPATALSPASRRQSISNVHIPSTRTGRETTPPHSFRTAVADDVLDKSTRTGREASQRLPVTADPQLITRTTVVPVNQNGEGGPPGVMLFVHSFYVFSMTLDAWANHLSNQNPAQNVTQNPAQ